jgi:hypothetical protein
VFQGRRRRANLDAVTTLDPFDKTTGSKIKFETVAESVAQNRLDPGARREGYYLQAMGNSTGLTLEESYGHGSNMPFHPEDRQQAW